VTSLPDARAPKWKLHYKSGRLHSWHKGDVEEIRANPFRYWTRVWKKDLKGQRSSLSEVFFLNVDRGRVVSFNMND
jgi:hypothetical protein